MATCPQRAVAPGEHGECGCGDLVLREARVADAAAILSVLNPIISSGRVAFDGPLSEEDERHSIADFPSRGVFLVAARASDGVIVGFQCLEPFASRAHLFDHVGVISTYVASSWRRRGVATRLFAATVTAARAKGYEKLLTCIRADNRAALAAYERQGFRVVGRAERQVKRGGDYADELIVECFI